MSSVTGYAGSLLLLVVLAIAAGTLAWQRHRSAPATAASGRLRMLAVTSAGARDRLLLVECDGRRYLLARGDRGLTLIDRLPDSATASMAALFDDWADPR